MNLSKRIGLVLMAAAILPSCLMKQVPKTMPVPGEVAAEEMQVIVSGESVYQAFTKAAYEAALAGDRVVFLDFFANWCPYCRAEAPVIEEGFRTLTSDRVAGFRVNYNDSETDEDEKALARQFNVPYQHTKIILKDGKQVFRSGEVWTKADFDRELSKVLAE